LTSRGWRATRRTEWVPRAIERDIDLGFDSPLAGAAIRGDSFC
jgi:hypothetical protein